MADNLVIKWDRKAIERVIGESPELKAQVQGVTDRWLSAANSIGAGYRTAIFHRGKERVGDTPAQYAGDVQMTDKSPKWPVGMVHPANYSAMKDNTENNTLLKVIT